MEPKISFAIITERLNSTEPIADFLLNAEKYNHKIESVIVGYTLEVDPAIAGELNEITNLKTVRVGGDDDFFSDLRAAGVNDDDIDTLFVSKSLPKCGKTTYARYRNTVTAAGLLYGTDHLLCFDTDVYPRLLLPDPTSKKSPACRTMEIDFTGGHKEYLLRDNVFVTTSDYSGYYILPPMKFEGMEDFFFGIQKETAYDYMMRCDKHKCLNFASESRNPFSTDKLLGGNLGLDLNKAALIPPFFSTLFMFHGFPVQGRGEDTLLGLVISAAGGKCMDIDLWIFHNTFGTFPKIPDLRQKRVRDRLYRGSLGWVARNPFFNWFLREAGFEREVLSDLFRQRRKRLVKGSKAVAEALNDKRFLNLPEAFDISVDLLDETIRDFWRLSAAWRRLVRILLKNRE